MNADAIGRWVIGRLYLQRKFGRRKYNPYVMVLFAGYGAGVGLIGMASVALALIAASTASGGTDR